jgi:hypothetical protein
MDQTIRFTSFIGVVVFSACTSSIAAPASPAAVMLGEWSYAAPIRIIDPPSLNTGLHVLISIDSAEGMRFWGRVTLWFGGDVGISLSAFGRVWGQIDESNGVMLEIPRASPGQAAVRVVGELVGDVLTVHGCSSGAVAGPFAIGTMFERSSGSITPIR